VETVLHSVAGVDLGMDDSESLPAGFAETAFSSAFYGAGEGIRTLDVHLGKVALYH
jgi:hypothetical protein